jgi:mersacidin/lichenicidin family type 2 lantibiotic
MNLEEIIRAWKSAEETVEPHLPASPVGEISEEELLTVNGGAVVTCDPADSCWFSISF